jgi:hypothetical protein
MEFTPRTRSTFLLALALVPTIALAAKVKDPQELACLREAYTNEQEAIVDAEEKYNRALEAAMQKRTQAISQAWTILDDDDRRTALRDASEEFRDGQRETRSVRRDALREARDTRRDAVRECHNEARDREDEDDDENGRSSSARN